jgi:diaminohydroxyphosphoribosylaminopyrimidine deaminase/5-amino-6-(5-phosphoribosylamino)uracil reductase
MINANFMLEALAMAEVRQGFCAPNPSVGAVVVKDGQLLSRGKHLGCGSAHAEVDAILPLGDVVKGATLYVTLEPCCHRNKRTPPCTDLIIKSGIKKVYYAIKDPNPAVAGQGADLLRQHGIDCEELNLEVVERFYRSYRYWWKTKMPWVTAKLALSLDGKIAGVGGAPLVITGKECAQYTHAARKKSDAILTTAQTILSDDPQLNARIEAEIFKKPVYVLDRLLRLCEKSDSARIFQTAASLTLFHDPMVDPKKIQKLQALNIRCIAIECHDEQLNLQEILFHIGHDGMHDLWVEAGGICLQSFVEQKLLQRLILYVAPKVLGQEACSAFKKPLNLPASEIEWLHLGSDAVCLMELPQE